MISFISVSQGNPIALRRTIDNVKASFGGAVNEFIVGDVSIFDDINIDDFPETRLVTLPFNYLFKHGFAHMLNDLAVYATNKLCIYLNVGEQVEKNMDLSLLSPRYNCYAFNHATDPHKWIRTWDKTELRWNGIIHEEIVGPKRLCPRMLFCMEDTPKDNTDALRAGVYNDVKEMVYFQQYVRLVEDLDARASAHPHWVAYAQDNYADLLHRLNAKGKRYIAFKENDKAAYKALAEEANLSSQWSKP